MKTLLTEKMPSVSVIIPTYNCADFINEAILSITRQTYKNREIIIVDDGSTDKTRDVIANYSHDTNYIFQKNRGPSSARNRGIGASTGKYLMFLDADDIAEKNCIKEHVLKLENNPLFGMSYCALSFIDNTGKNKGSVFRSKEYGKDKFLGRMIEKNLIASTSAVMIRRDVLDRSGYFDETLPCNAEEYELWLRIAENWPVAYIDKPLLRYRRHAGNMTNKTARQRKNEISILKGLGRGKIIKKVGCAYKREDRKLLALAKVFLKLGDYTEAFACLKKVPESGVNNDEIHFLLGSYYFLNKDYKKASKEYRLSLDNNRRNAASCNNLGVLLCKDGLVEPALKFFNKALDIKNDYHDPFYNIACIKGGKDTGEMRVTIMPLREVLVPYAG